MVLRQNQFELPAFFLRQLDHVKNSCHVMKLHAKKFSTKNLTSMTPPMSEQLYGTIWVKAFLRLIAVEWRVTLTAAASSGPRPFPDPTLTRDFHHWSFCCPLDSCPAGISDTQLASKEEEQRVCYIASDLHYTGHTVLTRWAHLVRQEYSGAVQVNALSQWPSRDWEKMD